MRVTVKVFGVFRSALGSESISLSPPQPRPTVQAIIDQLISRPNSQELKRLLLGDESLDPRSASLILVSGREIGALDGLDTILNDEDEIALLPIAHGG